LAEVLQTPEPHAVCCNQINWKTKNKQNKTDKTDSNICHILRSKRRKISQILMASLPMKLLKLSI